MRLNLVVDHLVGITRFERLANGFTARSGDGMSIGIGDQTRPGRNSSPELDLRFSPDGQCASTVGVVVDDMRAFARSGKQCLAGGRVEVDAMIKFMVERFSLHNCDGSFSHLIPHFLSAPTNRGAF